jgi:arylformamidase
MIIKKIFDLTYEIHEGMLTFNAFWHSKVLIKQMGRHETVGRETRKIVLGTHTGTHVDASLHFISGGRATEQIPPEKLIGSVTIIDFSYLKKNAAVSREMLKKIKITKRMLFKFGWGKHWNTKKFYNGYPFFTVEAAKYLIKNKVEMVAIDTPSPDDSRIKLVGGNLGSDRDSPVHKLFLKAGVILVEYIANLNKLSDRRHWNIVVAPLKIRGADGSPARVYLFK